MPKLAVLPSTYYIKKLKWLELNSNDEVLHINGRLTLCITSLVALGFPPACINSDTTSESPIDAARCKGVSRV